MAFLAVRGDKQGLLFTFTDRSLLTKGRFVAGVHQALQKAGVDCKQYSGHSFRIGAATTANMRGMGDATIKMLGRWQSTAYLTYVKTPRDQLAKMSSIIGHIPQVDTEIYHKISRTVVEIEPSIYQCKKRGAYS